MKSLYISRFICFIVFLFCAFDIMAYHDKDIMINGINIRLDQYGTAVVSYYNRGFQGKNLVIPSHVTYDGEVYTVTRIETRAFENNQNIESVTIPYTMESIWSYAFKGCINIKEVFWNAKNCGSNGDMYTENIEHLIIGPEVEVLPWGAASGSKITEVTIPNSVTTIGSYAFYNCSGLTSIEIPNSVTTIGYRAFYGCSGLTSINIPNAVTHIGSEAFCGCSGFKDIILPSTLTTLETGVFYNCGDLNTLFIPSSITSYIGSDAFNGCSPKKLIWNVKSCSYNGSMNTSNIEELIIGPEVEVLPENLASGSKITEVTIPNSVTTIDHYAFYNCLGLTRIKISNSVTNIYFGAFEGCSPKELIWNAKNCGSNGDMYTENIEHLVIGPEVEVLPMYLASGSKITEVTIPNSVTTICGGAFKGCSPKELIWNVKNCGYNGSMNTGNIERLEIGPEVEVLPENLAYGSKITEVTIPNSVTSIGRSAFSGCTGLTSIEIPNSVTTIGQYAFNSNCLRSIFSLIEDPASVTLGYRVFWNVPKDLCVLHVPSGTEDLYRNADQWKDFLIKEEYEMKTAFSKGFEESFPSSIEPEGVTADGASRMYIYFDQDIDDVKSVDLKCSVIEETSDPAIIGYFGEFKKLPNGKWGFDYRAPEDFPEDYSTQNKYSITLEVKVMDNSDKEWVGCKTFTVMRPGVLLLHGLLANESTFEAQYRHLLNEGGYEPCQVWNASYEPTHAESFYSNTYLHRVVHNCLKTIYYRMAALGIISSKYDLVGHSMGGVLQRLYAQNVNPDAVNRIITLDTPHHGSHLANAYEPALNTLLAVSILSQPFVAVACHLLHRYLSSPEYGAFRDLAPSSPATQGLNSKRCAGIPIHAIGSYMKESTHYEEVGCHPVNGVGLFTNYIFSICEYKEVEDDHSGFQLMDGFYHGENDGIVSLSSQLGGLSGTYKTEQFDTYRGVLGLASNAHHTKTHHWDKTIDAITGLLKRPKTDPCFTTSGFRAPANYLSAGEQPAMPRVPKFKEAPETSFINLTLNKNEDEDDRNLGATVSASDDIESFFVFACLDEDKYLVSTWETEPTFVIPDNYEGNLMFYVLGRTANDELVADMDSVEYSSITSLAALDFEDDDDLTMTVGQTLGLNVIATWDNGESEYVKPTYSATPGGILNIDGQMFTPVAVGECELIAEYKGFTCRKKVTVYPGSEPVTSRFDVNLDGEVSVADVNEVIGLILLPKDGLLGDVNGDGEVNIADINAIIDEILSK